LAHWTHEQFDAMLQRVGDSCGIPVGPMYAGRDLRVDGQVPPDTDSIVYLLAIDGLDGAPPASCGAIVDRLREAARTWSKEDELRDKALVFAIGTGADRGRPMTLLSS
jgi:hypothetical protein